MFTNTTKAYETLPSNYGSLVYLDGIHYYIAHDGTEYVRVFDDEGYDQYGYDEDGYDKDGYWLGYDEDGYDKDGYNKYGYDRDGYYRDGYGTYTVEIKTSADYGNLTIKKEVKTTITKKSFGEAGSLIFSTELKGKNANNYIRYNKALTGLRLRTIKNGKVIKTQYIKFNKKGLTKFIHICNYAKLGITYELTPYTIVNGKKFYGESVTSEDADGYFSFNKHLDKCLK